MIRVVIGTCIVLIMLAFAFFHHPRHPGNLVEPITNYAAWRIVHQGVESRGIDFEGDTLHTEIFKADGWLYIEVYQTKVALIPGRRYHLHFKARSDKATFMKVAAMANKSELKYADSHFLGLCQDVNITDTTWKDFDYDFTASATDGQADRVPDFHIGYTAASIWIKDIVLEEE